MSVHELTKRTRRYLRSPKGRVRERCLRVLGYDQEQIIGNAVVTAMVCDPAAEPVEYEQIQVIVQQLLDEDVEARR